MSLVKPYSDSTRTNLCQRCKSLQLLTHVERPWKSKPTLSTYFEIATINQDSINSSCTLCMQFGFFLSEFRGDGILHLKCDHALTEALDRAMNQFSMTFEPSFREMLLLPKKPLVFRPRDIGHMPFESRKSWPKDLCTDILSDQPLRSDSPDYDQLKAWIRQCYAEHKATCGSWKGHRIRPDRVIDCEKEVLCTNEEAYVCLSYIWGPAPVGTEELGKSLPQDLPQTIRDAMSVTLNIGLRYLWVDRYCIDQNDADEKHNIIKNMNAIYEGAALTIIAAAGADPNYGLPGVTRTRRPNPTLTVGNHTFAAVEEAEQEIMASQWNTRGWTYQEALLSRRCLVFTDTQVYLQCLSDHYHEYGGRTWIRRHYNRVFPDHGVGSTPLAIYSRLSEYWTRGLSYETDILNAFSGIFQAFSKLQSVELVPLVHHFYGIPILHNRHSGSCTVSPQVVEINGSNMCQASTSFALGLAWKVSTRFKATTAIMQNDLFPSWTWASLKPCRSDSRAHSSLKFYNDESNWTQVLRDLDSTIKIRLCYSSGAELDLADYTEHQEDYTRFRPLLDIRSYVVHVSTVSQYNSSAPKSIGISAFPRAWVWWQRKPPTVGEKLVALYVGTTEPFPGSNQLVFILVKDNGEGEYCRVGVFEIELKVRSIERWYDHPSRNYTTFLHWLWYGYPTKNYNRFLKDTIDGPEWHQKTLRLV